MVNTWKYRVVLMRVSNALSKSGIPGLDYALNPYMGCLHSCIYCYARDFVGYREVSDHWGEVVFVKKNLVDLLKYEVMVKKPGIVGIGTITDAYQPIEAIYKITRESIEILLDRDFYVSIQTKNSLILRDIDILLKYIDRVDVGFTITTLDKDVAGRIEPKAPPPKARVDALYKLSSKGINTWIFIGPIIPRVNDDFNAIKEIIDIAKDTDSTVYVDQLHIKKFMYRSSSEIIKHSIEYTRKYKWSTLFNKIQKYCRDQGVKCIIVPKHEYRKHDDRQEKLNKYFQ